MRGPSLAVRLRAALAVDGAQGIPAAQGRLSV
jgi:hypothetical protein